MDPYLMTTLSRPFHKFILPLLDAARKGNEFEVMQILRTQSPLLKRDKLKGVEISRRLAEFRELTQSLQQKLRIESTATNAEVLRMLRDSEVIDLDPRILSYINTKITSDVNGTALQEDSEGDDGENLTKEISAMEAFLACRASQFWGYYNYLNNHSPFSTQQGIKGTEFDRVLVILDDHEGTHKQFSYHSYFALTPPSKQPNVDKTKETIVDRTRRLFYVCCTRARRDLVVVLFTNANAIARDTINELGLFSPQSIHDERTLAPLNPVVGLELFEPKIVK